MFLNKIKKKFIDLSARLMWEKTAEFPSKSLFYNQFKPFADQVPRFSDGKVNQKFLSDNTLYVQEEYVKSFQGSIIIEPDSGFLINDKGKIITPALQYDHISIYPSRLKYLKRKNITEKAEVILFDHIWGLNYFHFHADIISKILYLKDHAGELGNKPLILGHQMAARKWFRFYEPVFRKEGIEFYFQKPDEFIHSEIVWRIQPDSFSARNWNFIRKSTESYRKPLNPARKVFINRPAAAGRNIENFEEIRPLLTDLGFEIAELGGKSLPEQIELFSSAGTLVSIHGAGLTNLVFSHPEQKVLEIIPDGFISTHYYWLSLIFGISNYDCLLGSEIHKPVLGHARGKFYLDSDQLISKLSQPAHV